MKTLLGIEIPETTRGIVYLCEYNYKTKELKVFKEILCNSTFEALEYYANIPNPESQMASGKDFDSFIKELEKLHLDMHNPEWLHALADYL